MDLFLSILAAIGTFLLILMSMIFLFYMVVMADEKRWCRLTLVITLGTVAVSMLIYGIAQLAIAYYNT